MGGGLGGGWSSWEGKEGGGRRLVEEWNNIEISSHMNSLVHPPYQTKRKELYMSLSLYFIRAMKQFSVAGLCNLFFTFFVTFSAVR